MHDLLTGSKVLRRYPNRRKIKHVCPRKMMYFFYLQGKNVGTTFLQTDGETDAKTDTCKPEEKQTGKKKEREKERLISLGANLVYS